MVTGLACEVKAPGYFLKQSTPPPLRFSQDQPLTEQERTMSRFTQTRPAPGTVPTGTTDQRRYTNEGAIGFDKDIYTEVFTLGLTFLTDEFYESANQRVDRFAEGIRILTGTDAAWVHDFLVWLRTDANIRTAAVVGAVEATRAGAGSNLLPDVLSRGDEPAEALGYFMSRHGRKLPAAVKRGIAKSATKLYTERMAIRYTSGRATVTPADVIALTRPRPKDDRQSAVFTYLGDIAHKRTDPRIDGLELIPFVRSWMENPALVMPAALPWEQALSRGVEAGLDRTDLWKTLLTPTGDGQHRLGYMALLRNLRNIEEAGLVNTPTWDIAMKRLADPDEVARSKQLPFRFYSAYRNTSVHAHSALELALDASLSNIPTYKGRSLVMVDTSGSMQGWGDGGTGVAPVDVAALFASAIKRRSPDTSVWIYADRAVKVDFSPPSVLQGVAGLNQMVGSVGHGTQTWPSTEQALASDGKFDRVIVLTDMQDHPRTGGRIGRYSSVANADLPIYVYDLQGYKTSNVQGDRGRYLLSGRNDQLFKVPALVEAGRDAGWPWEQTG